MISKNINLKKNKLLYLFISCRPSQWTKNLIVFAAPLFSFGIEKNIWITSFLAFICFCLISSSVYLINDCIDIEADRKHPRKSKRPIASGLVDKKLALFTSIFFVFLTTSASYHISAYLTLIIISYFIIQLAYCLQLKKRPLLDLFCISSGFLLRSFSGLVASDLKLSPWFILSVGLLSLFLAVEKRKAELSISKKTGICTRNVLNYYSYSLLLRLESTLATSTFMSYALWAAGPVVNGASSSLMLLTTPLVLIGIFRYQLLGDQCEINSENEISLNLITEKPESVLLNDKGIRLIVFTWLVLTILIGFLT